MRVESKSMTIPFKIVEVSWLDAHVSTEEMSVKKAQRQKPVLTTTIASLVAENKHGVVLATDTYPEDPKNVKIVNFIPWGVIEEYWEFVDEHP